MGAMLRTFDARSLMAKTTITVTVKVRGMWKVRLGLLLIRFGAWVSGLGYEEVES